MDFKQIEAFVNVVRYKSFSKAADATFFTQPTISTHISNLEKELGTKLLDRNGRHVEMTPKGASFYKYAIEMINSREKAQEALNSRPDDIAGILELQTSSIPAVCILPELMAEFRRTHGKIQYYVTLSDSQSTIDNITDRRGELGFVGDKLATGSLEYTRLFSDQTVMIAPASYGLEGELELEEATRHPIIWRETGSASRKAFESAAAKLGFDKTGFDIAALFNDLDSIIRSVEKGLGIAIISQKVADTIVSDKITVHTIKDFSDSREFYMVKLKGASLSPSAEAFEAFVLDKFKQ